MTDFFAEKAHQIEPSTLTAFGIQIDSRYAQAHELIQLMKFAENCALSGVAHFVRRAWYDSKAAMCSIELSPDVQDGDPVAATILEAATATIAQFLWFDDAVHHCDDELIPA